MARRIRGGDGASAYAAPGRATSLAGLPPTYLAVAQFDPLRGENLAYGRRLLDHGVPGRHRRWTTTRWNACASNSSSRKPAQGL
ncbi:alpha/beta hydrolase fold domain-containing protein [Streptomyces sp. NPDC023723]|uniref:alpha/beta hydrolase fold domain-containing protein n=1 Tax=Streptomyces sp. NPDC023723 TaxID=3154323 RepID=UPI0033C6F9FB